MELFSIQCTTCKARLVVKDESLIGDILSCPKCRSMVQVVPPVGWKRPGAGDSSPGELPAVSTASSQPSAAASDKPDGQPPADESPPIKAAAAAAAIPPALPARTTPADSAAVAATPMEPAPATTLLSAAVAWARRDWIVLAGGLSGGIALGAVVWLVVVVQSPPPLTVAHRAPQAIPSRDPANDVQPRQPSAAAPAPAGPQLAEATPGDAAPQEPEVVATAEPAEVESAAAVEPDNTKPQAGAAPAAADAAGVEDAAPPQRGPALKLDPIRRSAAPIDLANVVPSASAAAAPRDLPPEDPEPADDAASAAAAESPGKAVLSREQIDARLSISLASVEFADVPLAQFAAFIADVSGVPVALDETALPKSDRTRNMPISVKLSRTTAGEALRAAVGRAGLSLAHGDGRIVITRAPE